MNKRDYLFLILLFVLHGACSDPSLEPETRKKHTTLKGFLSVPPSLTVSPTARTVRSDLSTIDVLVFSEDSIFLEWKKAVNLSPAIGIPGTYTYDLTLSVDPSLTNERTLHYLINANLSAFSASDFAGLHEGEVRGMLIDRKEYNISGDTDYTMWGSIHLPDIAALTTLPSIEVIRDAARISISWNGISNFVCDDIKLYNTFTAGMIIPSAPATLTEPASATTGIFDARISGQTAVVHAYERKSNASPYLILKGKYGSTAATFYRIALAQVNPPAYTPLDIKRNHQYDIRILEIDGPGYATLDEALRYPPFNHIRVTTVVNEDSAIKDVITNGQYSLELTRSDINLLEPTETEGNVTITRMAVTRINGVTGTIPTLDDIRCTLVEESGTTTGEDFILGKTAGEFLPLNPSGELILRLPPLSAAGTRKAKIRVTVGNLSREISIRQSRLLRFEVGSVFYVGWEKDCSIRIPVTLPVDTANPTGNINITLAQTGSASFTAPGTSVQTGQPAQTVIFALTTSSGYYGEHLNNTYRTMYVKLSAEGFQDEIIAIKQSKYFDGITGKGIIGIYRDDNDDGIYPVVLDDTKELWTATVTQGDDFIRIGGYDATDLGTGSITGEKVVRFTYRLLPNTTGNDRYGKIVITYGLSNATHTIYVHQGFRDIQIGSRYWAARNVNTPGNFTLRPDVPGGLYQMHTTTHYDAITPGIGIDYPGYQVQGQSTGTWTISPAGYTVPGQTAIATLKGQITSGNIGDPVIPTGEPIAAYFNKIFYGRINDPEDPLACSGILLIKEDVEGDLIQTFFLPCPGYRIKASGRLTSTHAHRYPTSSPNPYYYSNGMYWGNGGSVIDIFHDPAHNVGLLAPGNANAFLNDGDDINSLAAPVRCIRE